MAESTPRTGRWLRIALGLSLALNLLVVGLIAGASYRFHGSHGGQGGMMRSYGTPYIMALPDDRRRAIFRDLRARKDDHGMTRAARRAIYDQVVVALRAVPFEVQQVTQVLDQQRTATLRVQEASQTAWLAEIAGMTDADRAAYADRLQEVLSRGPKHMRDRRQRRSGD